MHVEHPWDDREDYWPNFVRSVFRETMLDDSEVALWIAVTRYAERPSKGRERKLKRAARAFGIEPDLR